MWILFFNFYILELGFDRQFLGLINSVTSMATLVLGIPLGMLSDRIDRKKAMMLGVGIYALASTLELLVINPILLLCMAFLNGAGRMIYLLNVAPFLAKASTPENRTALFSLNFGMIILAGVFGNLFASQLAAWFAAALQISVTSVIAYRGILLFAASLNYLVLILLALIQGQKSENADDNRLTKRDIPSGRGLIPSLGGLFAHPIVRQLALVQLVFGLGIALLTPYINLFFDEKFQVSPQILGEIFALKALFTGAAAMLVPRLVGLFHSRIRIAVLFQFLGGVSWLVLGFSPGLGIAVCGYLLGGVFLNTPIPLIEEFSMGQVDESQRATLVSIRELSWQASWSTGPYLSGSLQERFGFSIVFAGSVAAIWLASLMNRVFFGKIEK